MYLPRIYEDTKNTVHNGTFCLHRVATEDTKPKTPLRYTVRRKKNISPLNKKMQGRVDINPVLQRLAQAVPPLCLTQALANTTRTHLKPTPALSRHPNHRNAVKYKIPYLQCNALQVRRNKTPRVV